MKSKGLIISDTHWYSSAYIPDFLFNLFEESDFIIHAGDWTDISVVDVFESMSSLFAVCGNCDGSDVRRRLPVSRAFNVGNLHIGVTHGTRKSSSVINDLTREFSDCQLIIFGHSHVPFVLEQGGKTFFNPGSFSLPRGGHRPSYGICEIEDGRFSLAHLYY